MTLDTIDRALPPGPEEPDEREGEGELLRTFTVTVVEPTTPASLGDHQVTSEYVEEKWLGYLGPLSLLIARRIARWLSNVQDHTRSVMVKDWTRDLGNNDAYEFLCACNRLVRWGLADWDPVKAQLTMKRRWPDVSPMIQTVEHRVALLAIVDPPLTKQGR